MSALEFGGTVLCSIACMVPLYFLMGCVIERRTKKHLEVVTAAWTRAMVGTITQVLSGKVGQAPEDQDGAQAIKTSGSPVIQ